MKVVHVITRMIAGGAQENTLLSAAGQAAIPDNEVILATGPETGTEGNLLDGWSGDVHIATIPTLVRAVRPTKDLRALIDLYRLFRRERPDVVHTHSSKAGVLGRIAAKAARVPLVVHTLHSLVFHDYQPVPLNRALRITKRALVPFTDYYASVSDDIRERAIAAGVGRRERHATVYSGFQTKEFARAVLDRTSARAELGLPTDRVIVGVVGRLFELKGHDEVLAAGEIVAKACPEVLFVFIGSGPLETALRELAASRGLTEHLVFLGRLPVTMMPIAYSALDVLTHASLREGLARVIPQAVIAGAPVVCYDLDGSREVVTDGVNGYLVPPRDTDALARRLIELISDESLRARMGGVGAEELIERFSAATMVRELDSLYRRELTARCG